MRPVSTILRAIADLVDEAEMQTSAVQYFASQAQEAQSVIQEQGVDSVVGRQNYEELVEAYKAAVGAAATLQEQVTQKDEELRFFKKLYPTMRGNQA